jgi:hypothetical protein
MPRQQQWNGWRVGLDNQAGVYEICCDAWMITQIGSGPVLDRVGRRFTATFLGRFDAPDSIWWVYDLLVAGRRPTVRSLLLDGRTPLAAEQAIRLARLEDGWQVSSVV